MGGVASDWARTGENMLTAEVHISVNMSSGINIFFIANNQLR
jgi:hypothetical protein